MKLVDLSDVQVTVDWWEDEPSVVGKLDRRLLDLSALHMVSLLPSLVEKHAGNPALLSAIASLTDDVGWMRTDDDSNMCTECCGVGGHLTSCPRWRNANIAPVVIDIQENVVEGQVHAFALQLALPFVPVEGVLRLRQTSRRLCDTVDAARYYWHSVIRSRWGRSDVNAAAGGTPDSMTDGEHPATPFSRYLALAKQHLLWYRALSSRSRSVTCSRWPLMNPRGDLCQEKVRRSPRHAQCAHCRCADLMVLRSHERVNHSTGSCSMSTLRSSVFWEHQCGNCGWYTRTETFQLMGPDYGRHTDSSIRSISQYIPKIDVVTAITMANRIVQTCKRHMSSERWQLNQLALELAGSVIEREFCYRCGGVSGHTTECGTDRMLPPSPRYQLPVAALHSLPKYLPQYLGDLEAARLRQVCKWWLSAVGSADSFWSRRFRNRFGWSFTMPEQVRPFAAYRDAALQHARRLDASKATSSVEGASEQVWYTRSRKRISEPSNGSTSSAERRAKDIFCAWCGRPLDSAQAMIGFLEAQTHSEDKGHETSAMSEYTCSGCGWFTQQRRYHQRQANKAL